MNKKLLSSALVLMLAVGAAFLYTSMEFKGVGLWKDYFVSAHAINGHHIVNMTDVMIVIDAFGSYNATIGGGIDHPRWNGAADISGPNGVPDGIVDMNDLILVLTEFGQPG
jgi:hypothetical protein